MAFAFPFGLEMTIPDSMWFQARAAVSWEDIDGQAEHHPSDGALPEAQGWPGVKAGRGGADGSLVQEPEWLDPKLIALAAPQQAMEEPPAG